MATTSEVDAGLDDVSEEIRNARRTLKQAKAAVNAAAAALANIPTKYAALNTEINGYTGADDFETHAIAKRDRLVVELNALRTKADGAKADLDAYDFSV